MAPELFASHLTGPKLCSNSVFLENESTTMCPLLRQLRDHSWIGKLRASGSGSQGAPVLSKAGKYIIGKQNEHVASLPSSVDVTLHLCN